MKFHREPFADGMGQFFKFYSVRTARVHERTLMLMMLEFLLFFRGHAGRCFRPQCRRTDTPSCKSARPPAAGQMVPSFVLTSEGYTPNHVKS